MFKKFIELSTKLFFHLFFIWVILIISSALIFLIYYTENFIETKVAQQFSRIQLLLYLDHDADYEDLKECVGEHLSIKNYYTLSGEESLAGLEEEYNLKNLTNWVKQDEIPDVMGFRFVGKDFNTTGFVDLLEHLSQRSKVNYFDYNRVKLNQLIYWNSRYNKYKRVPYYIIILLAGVIIFLIRRLIRAKCKKIWFGWKLAGSEHLYKIVHLFLEFFYMLIAVFLAFLLPLYFWKSEIFKFLQINSLEFNYSFYYVFSLIGAYVVISGLNQIARTEKQ